MREELVDAVSKATPERIAEAIEAGIQAGYVDNPTSGHAAVLEVLNRPEAEPVAEEAPAPTEEDLDALSKEELVERATAQDLTVTRADGEDGEPLKADYVKALKRAARKA